MALNSSAVVSSMVVETAVPYAPASLSELPKLKVRTSVQTIIVQFTTGT